jgi:retrograde regulation protein 2
MARLLASTDTSPDPAQSRAQLAETMRQQFAQAFTDLQLPSTLQDAARRGNLRLYLSGGGFRGWGYLLFSQHKVSPYPIPIINGFTVSKHAFMQTASLELLVSESSEHADAQSAKGTGIFRISKRRATQVPAVAFLVNVLVQAIPCIREIRFCQGGVREGFLFDALPQEIRTLSPLTSATAQYASPSAAEIAELLHAALPSDSTELDRAHPASLTRSLCRAIADLMYFHQRCPKESRALAALYAPVTGVLASVHGISHVDRALLSLVLYARWDAEVAPPHDDFVARLQRILTGQEAWWAGYIGSVAALIGNIYPAGIVPEVSKRMKLKAKWAEGLGKKGLEMGVKLCITVREGDVVTAKEGGIRAWVEEIEKVGKRKKREALERSTQGGGGGLGVGVRVEVEVERVKEL